MLPLNNQPIRALSLTAALLVFCVDGIAQEAEVASSKDLLGEPTNPEEPAKLQLAKATQATASLLEVSESQISRPDGKLTLRVTIKNITEATVDFDVRSAFIRTDGSIVETPYPLETHPIEGMARGFVGLISLGASEVAMELESAEPTISTSHKLESGKAIIVEHQLPYADENVVGARAFVSAGDTTNPEHENEVRRTLDEQYWKARDQYFAERKAENQRWDRERKSLEKQREDLPALSADYKKVMSKYWDEHRSHLARLQEIEKRFDRFRKDQKQRLSTELSQE
ncbi:MAG: hypothetical protein AAF585_08305 [Verrucomicrobiota bacterium]